MSQSSIALLVRLQTVFDIVLSAVSGGALPPMPMDMSNGADQVSSCLLHSCSMIRSERLDLHAFDISALALRY